MESGCLTFTTSSAAPSIIPSRSFCLNKSQLNNFAANYSCSNGLEKRGKRTTKPLLNYSCSNRNSTAVSSTLSSNWDVCNDSSPSWMPRFEELDTTNMLLRQRIVFLGSQVYICSILHIVVCF